MKFSAVLLSAASVAVVAAQSTTAPPAPSTTQNAYTPEQQKCIDGCGSDLNCQAECLGAPGPNENMLGDVHDCYAKCDQGDGSPEATEKFAKCGQACISEYYFSSTLGAGPKTAGGASTAPASSTVVTSTATDGKVVTATQAAPEATGASTTGDATPSPSANAAQSVRVGGAMAGIFAAVAAVFAL